MNASLPAVVSTMSTITSYEDMTSNEELMQALGLVKEAGFGLPRLSVNYDSVDAQDRKVDTGVFKIDYKSDVVYSPTCKLQIIAVKKQYVNYDNEKKAFISASMYFDNWGEDIPDSAGTFNCGRMANRDDITPEQKKFQDNISAKWVVFGLLTMDGETPSGVDVKGRTEYKPVKIENYPVKLIVGGLSFMEFADFRKANHNRTLNNFTTLTLDRKKEDGKKEYWVLKFNIPNTGEPVGITYEQTIEAAKQFLQMIADENKAIMSKHMEARQEAVNDEAPLAEDFVDVEVEEVEDNN